MDAQNPRERFSDRVDDYVKYRPSYPAEAIAFVCDAAGVSPATRVVDLGAGTGLSSEPFLRLGCEVVGVEPNRAMREAGQRYLARFERYRLIDGAAEATTLPDATADLVIAGQAFHWFDVERTRDELARIVAPSGNVALLWNDRRVNDTAFLRDYDALLRSLATDYAQVTHKNTTDADDARVARVLARGFRVARFENLQTFDAEGLLGRAMSSSYVPSPRMEGHESFVAALRALFARHAEGGQVAFAYDTIAYVGPPLRSEVGRSTSTR